MATFAGVMARGLDKDHYIAWQVVIATSKLELVSVKAGVEEVIYSTDCPGWWSAASPAIWLRLRIHYNQASCYHSQDGLTWTRDGLWHELTGMQSGTAWSWANFSTNNLIPNCTGRVGVVGQGWSNETDTW